MRVFPTRSGALDRGPRGGHNPPSPLCAGKGRRLKSLAIALAAVAFAALVACTATPKRDSSSPSGSATSGNSGGGYYKDDGPGDRVPENIDAIPDAVPRPEALHRFANRPYSVFGKQYVPATTLRPYKERGVASWYGRKFHGEKTSIGETYDMYAMTAAHPTLPLPSYARVTSVASGKSVIVRVNDRGPFLHDRIIDLSYAAAHRVGIAQNGSGAVIVEAILPGDAPVVTPAPLPPVPPMIATAPPVAPMDSPTMPGGFAVQLGAFASYANAQSFVEHVRGQLASAAVEAKVRQANSLFRVYVGPYATRDEARTVAQRLESAFGFATTLAPH